MEEGGIGLLKSRPFRRGGRKHNLAIRLEGSRENGWGYCFSDAAAAVVVACHHFHCCSFDYNLVGECKFVAYILDPFFHTDCLFES